MNKDLTFVFIGFDGYSDIWGDCFALFNRFWPDCPYKVLFVNNVKEVSYDNVQVLHAGADAEWSRKVQVAIKNADTPYICLLLEDFFLGKKIDTDLIEKTFQFIKDEKIRYYKLANMSRAVKNRDASYKGNKFLHVIPKSDGYGVSLQPAIWETNFLSAMLGTENYNAWIFEFDRVKEAPEDDDSPREGCVFDDRNILNLQHGVVQSKYIPSTVAYYNKIGYKLNIERECLTYFQYYRIRLRSFTKHMLPKKIRKYVKKIAEKFGMKFVSTVRDTKK